MQHRLKQHFKDPLKTPFIKSNMLHTAQNICDNNLLGKENAMIRVDHNDGQILSTMEWSMVFVKVPLLSMVFQWFLYNWTIAIE